MFVVNRRAPAGRLQPIVSNETVPKMTRPRDKLVRLKFAPNYSALSPVFPAFYASTLQHVHRAFMDHEYVTKQSGRSRKSPGYTAHGSSSSNQQWHVGSS